jgi:hypothetical protein
MKSVTFLRLLAAPCSDNYEASRVQALDDGSIRIKPKHRPHPPRLFDDALSTSMATWHTTLQEESHPWATIIYQGDQHKLASSIDRIKEPQPAESEEVLQVDEEQKADYAADMPLNAPSRLLHLIAQQRYITAETNKSLSAV